MYTVYDESAWINAQYKKSKRRAKVNPKSDSIGGIENDWYNKDGLFYSNNDEVFTMYVSNSYISRIIGKFGKKIREIQSRSGAIVIIEEDSKDFDKNVAIKLIGSRSSIKHAKIIIESLILKWRPQVENQRKSDKQSKIYVKPLENQEEEPKMYNKFYCLANAENISFNLPKSNYHELDNVMENVFQSASVNNENETVKMQNQFIGEEYFCSHPSKSNNLFQWNEVVEREKWDASWVYEAKNWNATIAEKVNKHVKQKQESSNTIVPAVGELDNDITDYNPNCSLKNKCWNEDAKNVKNLRQPVWFEDVKINIEESPIENLNKTWENKSKEIINQDFGYTLPSYNTRDYHRLDGSHFSKTSGETTSNSFSELNDLVEHEKWDAGWIYKSNNWSVKTAEGKMQEKKYSDTIEHLNESKNLENGNGIITEKYFVSQNNTDPGQLNESRSSEFLDHNQPKNFFNWTDVVEEEKWDATWIHETENWNTKVAEIENKNEKQDKQSTDTAPPVHSELDNDKSDCNLTSSDENEYWHEDIKNIKNQSSNTQYFSFSLTDSISNDLDLDPVNKNNDELLSANSNCFWSASENWENETEEIQKQNKMNFEEYFAHELGSQNSTGSTYLNESQSSKLLDENKPNNNYNSNWRAENKLRLINRFFYGRGHEDKNLSISNLNDESLSVNMDNIWKNWENKIEKNTTDFEEYFFREFSLQNSTNSNYLKENQSDQLSDENKPISVNLHCNENVKRNEDEHSNTSYFSLSLNESVDMTTLPTSNLNTNNSENLENESKGSCNNQDSCSSNESQFSKDLDENKSEKQFKWIEVINKEESDSAWKAEIDYCEARLIECMKNYESEKQDESSDATTPAYNCKSNCSDNNLSFSLNGSVCQELDHDDRIILQTSNEHKNNQESPNLYCTKSGEVQNQVGFGDEESIDYELSSQNSCDSNHSNCSKLSDENKTNNLLDPKELTDHQKWVSEWINVSENWKDDIAEGENENKKEEKESLDSVETVYMELNDAKADCNPNRSHEKEIAENNETAENLYLNILEYFCNHLEDIEAFGLQNDNESKNNYESENWHYSWSQCESSYTDIDEMQSPNSDKTNKTEKSYLSIDQSKLISLFEENEQVVQENLSDVSIQENKNWNIEIEENENKTKQAEKEPIYSELDNEENECCDQNLQTESRNKISFELVSADSWDNISSESENWNSKTEEITDQENCDCSFGFSNSRQQNEIQVSQPLSENIPNDLQCGCNTEQETEDQQQKIPENFESDVQHELDYDKMALKLPHLTGFKWSDLVIQEENKIQIEKIVRSYFKKSIQNEYWKSKDTFTITKQTHFGLTNSVFQNIAIEEPSCPTLQETFKPNNEWSKMDQEYNVNHYYELLIRSYDCKKWSNISKNCSNESETTQEERFNLNKCNFPKLKTDFTSNLENFLPENTTTNTVQCYLTMDENCYDKWSNDREDSNHLNEKTENKSNSIENVKTEMNFSSTTFNSPESTTDFQSYLLNSNESHSDKILPKTTTTNVVKSNGDKIFEEKLTADQEYELSDENNSYDKWSYVSEDWNILKEETENKNESTENVKTEMNFNSTKSISPESATGFTSYLINSNKIHSGELLPETTSANVVQCNCDKIIEEKLTADQEYELSDENNSYDKWSNVSEDWNILNEETENKNDSIENVKTEMNFNSTKSISPESSTGFTSYLLKTNNIHSGELLPESTSANVVQCNCDKINKEKLTADQEYELMDENNSFDKRSKDSEYWNNSNEEIENKNNSMENVKTKMNFSSTKSVSPESTTDFTNHLINLNEMHSGKFLPETSSANPVQCVWIKVSKEKLIAYLDSELKDKNPIESISLESTTDFASCVMNSNEIDSETQLTENSPANAVQCIYRKINEENQIADQEYELMNENNSSEETENKNNSIENFTTQEDYFRLNKSCSTESTTDSNKINFREMLTENTTTGKIISQENLISDQEYESMDENYYDRWSNDTEDWENPSEEAENSSIETLATHEDHFSLNKSIASKSATDFTSYLINSNEMKISEEKLIADQEYELLDENNYDKWSKDTENSSGKTENKNNSIENLTIQEEHFSLIKANSPEANTDFTSYLIISNENIQNENCDCNYPIGGKLIFDQEYEFMHEYCCDKISNDTKDWNTQTVETEDKVNSIENVASNEADFSPVKFSSPYSIHVYKEFFGKPLNENTSMNTDEFDSLDQEYQLFGDMWSNNTEDCSKKIMKTENKTTQEAHALQLEYLENSNKVSPVKTSTNTDECNWNKWTNEIEDWNKNIENTENQYKEETLLSSSNPFCPVVQNVKNFFDEQLNKSRTPSTSCCDWNNIVEQNESVSSRCNDKFNKDIVSSNLDTEVMDTENKKSKEEVSIPPNNDGIPCGSSQIECNRDDPINCNVMNVTEEKICDNKKINAELNGKQQNSKFVPVQGRPPKRKKKKRYNRR